MTKRRFNLLHATLAGMEELKHFPTPEARQRALDEHVASVKGWDLAAGIILTVLGAMAGWLAGHYAIRLAPFALPRYAADIARMLGIVTGLVVTTRLLHRWGTARDLRVKLLEAGVPVCLGCGYNLRGLKAARCPECGRGLDPRAMALPRASEREPKEAT